MNAPRAKTRTSAARTAAHLPANRACDVTSVPTSGVTAKGTFDSASDPTSDRTSGQASDRAAGEWLRPLAGHWTAAAHAHLSLHPALVRVTVLYLRGSAPREPGASMLVDARSTVGTIGGGQLEWHATAAARELLQDRTRAPVRILDLLLGPELGQCCGGRVELWLERLTRDDLPWLELARRRAAGRPTLGHRAPEGPTAGRSNAGQPIAERRELDLGLVTEVADGFVSHRLRRSPPGAHALELRRRVAAASATPAVLSPAAAPTAAEAPTVLSPAAAPTTGAAPTAATPPTMSTAATAPASPHPAYALPASRRRADASASLRRAAAPAAILSAAAPVTLLEVLTPRRPHVWIFGAGHVGQALVRMLAELALFDITWIDSRDHLLAPGLPDCVTPRAAAAPAALVDSARPATHYVVMTHDHGLDYDLCRAILRRGDAAWLGLIGSASKSARFRSRLLREGFDRDRLAGLACPIGVPGITSKLPAAIAIAIAAELLQRHATAAAATATSAPALPASLDCGGGCGSCGDAARQFSMNRAP
jgi:xanthine dehydrogenase accessory protein XdhC